MRGGEKEQLLKKLGEVAREINQTIQAVKTAEAPLAATVSQLPQASTHLSDVTTLTEKGTHQVMALTEAIMDNRAAVSRALDDLAHAVAHERTNGEVAEHIRAIQASLAEDKRRLMDLMTALAFQDIVGQRIRKVTAILADVEHRLLEMLIVFGAKQDLADGADGYRATALLKELEASRSGGLKQDLVDEILGQAGLS
jgi:chemotaxis protein CheZ